ncbi:MAG TPA: RES family NAD+ phosphorylase [Chitinophagaceae bacterium]|nr:RES family NAD+ phosphorylase [Chitinophagaceae bacterium]
MLVYRITHKAYSQSLFAPGLAGRWNGAGRKVIYTAESIPLAFMENLIRRKGLGFNDDFRIMILELPDTLAITEIATGSLAAGWRDITDYSICQQAGNAWYDGAGTPVLKVPSAVVPTNFNYVLHYLHPDFTQVKLITTMPLIPDDRIEDLLKNYVPPAKQ